ncbi:MAG TPA: FAD-binding oxidoreductase [Actinomycetota bacterium]|nr:FAD-binding oxidoreductase [Actinomycetota bacterium]
MGSRQELPASPEEAAELLRACADEGLRLRLRGGGTKLGWGRPAPEPDVEVVTGHLDRVVEHNAGDLTAVLQAGVPLATAQETFAAAGQMLALDPPLRGPGPAGEAAATVGGVVASGDSGPLRHRYGAARDLLLGITVALSDGTLARAGGKVIKNVAGYDLAKLYAGSFGTLGLIVEVVVRLHPRPPRTASVVGRTDDAAALGRAAAALAHAPAQMDCLDEAWGQGRGELLARFGGAACEDRAASAVALMKGCGLEAGLVEGDDAEVWERQRHRQRSVSASNWPSTAAAGTPGGPLGGGGAIVRVSGLPAELANVIRAAERAGGTLVGRAGLGLSWIELPSVAGAEELAGRIGEVRRELAPRACTVLDAPDEVRDRIDLWGPDPSGLALMRRLKERFDPAGVCNPGRFVGGI